ncbi:Transcriptional regulator [Archaeoglobus sulfaticallidus PM70-1]|uniref:Transcriptional regulator n=1 Tax=Archaeoglobus sulfaticallidus PM70-1 TaxID=387631 RepID=N0BN35_9EURY|nr:Lrp/AsnC family transcriptional regulator [Archaeoglobus sulfaticallidus]AGK62006.1 Transcriptional regulator [Archaeoglobus sulfaticallidus PM70-1]
MLDEIDKDILRLLQEDGNISLSEIANRLSVGVATVHRRIQRMKMDGIIKKKIVVVDPEKIGKNILAFIEIKTMPNYEDEILDKLSSFDEITEVYWVTGDFDLIVKLVVGDIKEFTRVIKKIREMNGVIDTKSAIVVKTKKEEYKIKI